MDQFTISPNRTVVASFATESTVSASNSYDEGDYILHVAKTKSPSKPLISCALSNQNVLTYDRETLKKVHSLDRCHNRPISDLCYSQIGNQSSQDMPMIVTSGLDGFVKIFDLRVNASRHNNGIAQGVLEMRIPDHEALSVSIGYNGALAAVGGSKGNIHFFDLRNIASQNVGSITKPLGTYVDAHTEEVTKVRFQNVVGSDGYDTTSLLVTAGEDGLVCTHDTSQPSEEEALKSVLNVQSPLRDVNFFGPSLEGIYCLTGSETMSFWHHDSAQRISDYGDVRNMLSSNAGIEINYLVGCHWDGSELNLIAGNTQGDCVIFHVDANSISVKRKLMRGHKSCIRAFVCDGSIVTGGEDSRLIEWNLNDERNTAYEDQQVTYSPPKDNALPQKGGGRIRRKKSKTINSPY